MPTLPPRPPKPKFKVVTPSTNPATSTSLTNPNGTYITPVTVGNPSTAAIGGAGQFGAMNPIKPPPGKGGMAIQPMTIGTGSFLAAGGTQALSATPAPSTPPAPSLMSAKEREPELIKGSVTSDSLRQAKGSGGNTWASMDKRIQYANSDIKNFMADIQLHGDDPNYQPNFNLLPSKLSLLEIKGLGLNAAALAEMGYTQPNPYKQEWVNTNKVGNQQPAGQQQQAQGAGNQDFANTGFMQYNQANNVAFEDQLRWDPVKKTYRKIGQIQADYGYLPNTEKKEMTLKERNARNKRLQREKDASKNSQDGGGYTPSGSASGSFNTATG